MKETQVKINAKVIDSKAHDQIKLMAESPAFRGLISIMPDVHPGMGSVIGFTGKFNNCVIPNVVGVDIGCGMTCYPLGKEEIDFDKLDAHIRKYVPMGFKSHEDESHLNLIPPIAKNISIILSDAIVESFYDGKDIKMILPSRQLGTLGGGNHFIEIEEDDEGNRFLTIHSGSRNFGAKVAKYHQDKAKRFHEAIPGSTIHKDLQFLPMEFGGIEYMKDLETAQGYAAWNRRIIIIKILNYFKIEFDEKNVIESIHNYIDPKDGIIRKGAISAREGEKVIIPLNMRDGVVIGTGKGKSSYNYSAPHGAGRVFGRNVMKQQLADGVVTMERFKEEMKDVYSTSVGKSTIDESPFAYKTFDDIKEYLEETVDIEKVMKPIYNLKAD